MALKRRLMKPNRQDAKSTDSSGTSVTTVLSGDSQVQASLTFNLTIMEIPVFTLDAFTNLPFKGNPAAICPLMTVSKNIKGSSGHDIM